MWGQGQPNNSGGNLQESITDNWIQQNVPGGLNSRLGEQLDNMMGGNPNPTYGQVVGGAPGVGGGPGNMGPGYSGNMGSGYSGNMGPGYSGNMGGPGYPGQYGGGSPPHHHHHHHDHY